MKSGRIQTVMPDLLLNPKILLTKGENIDLRVVEGIFTRNHMLSAYLINCQAMNYVFQDL